MADDYGFGSDWYSQLLANLGMSSAPTNSAPVSSGTDWGSMLDWGGGGTFAPSNWNRFEAGFADPGYEQGIGKFAANDQNAQLLASLGYGGQALQDGAWTRDATDWLNGAGYTVGVGHQPGTSSGGRTEYWGLMDPSGKYVSGQSDPTMTTSDTLMDQITPFLMMAGPFANAISTMEGLAAAGSSIGSLGAADTGLSALGSSWSPASLGITPVTPAITSSELAALGSGIPGAVGSAGAGIGAAGGLGSLGGGASGVTSLGSAWSPEALGLTQGITPAIGSTELAALGSGIPELSGLSPLIPDLPNLPDIPDYTPQTLPNIPDRAFPNIPDVPGLTPQTNWFQDLVKPISSAVKPIADAVGGSGNLGSIVGGLLGAASSKSGATTQTREPWAAAQPYLKGLLADAEAQRANLAANPFTPQQTQAYGNAYAGLDQARAALPGLLNWGQGAMQRQSTVPSYSQLFGQVKPG